MLVRRLTLWFGKTYGSRSGKNSGGIDHCADESKLHFDLALEESEDRCFPKEEDICSKSWSRAEEIRATKMSADRKGMRDVDKVNSENGQSGRDEEAL